MNPQDYNPTGNNQRPNYQETNKKQNNPYQTNVPNNNSLIEKYQNKQINKPKSAMLYYLWVRFSKSAGNWVFLAIHLILNLLILMIPPIVLTQSHDDVINSIIDNSINGKYYFFNDPEFRHIYHSVFITSLVINSMFIVFYGIYLGSSLFGSSKSDGIELMLVSKPITRRDIATMRIVFTIIIAGGYGLILLIWTPAMHAISFVGLDKIIDAYNSKLINEHNFRLNSEDINFINCWYLTKFSICYGIDGAIVIFGIFFACLLGISLMGFLSGLIASRLEKNVANGILFPISILTMSAGAVLSCTQTIFFQPVVGRFSYDSVNQAEEELNKNFKEWFASKFPSIKIDNPYFHNIDPGIIDKNPEKMRVLYDTKELTIDNTNDVFSEKDDHGNIYYLNAFSLSTSSNGEDYGNPENGYIIVFNPINVFSLNTDGKPTNENYDFVKNVVDILNKNYGIEENGLNLEFLYANASRWVEDNNINKPGTTNEYFVKLSGRPYTIKVKQKIYQDFYIENSNLIKKNWDKLFTNYSPIATVDYILPTSSLLYMQGLGNSLAGMNYSMKYFLGNPHFFREYRTYGVEYSYIYNPTIIKKIEDLNEYIMKESEKFDENTPLDKIKNFYTKILNFQFQKTLSIPTSGTNNPFWAHIIVNMFFISLISFFVWHLYQRKDFS